MAANSETFEFILDSTREVQLVHPDDSVPETVYSEPLKGDGYYGRADGLHTVQFHVTDFVGRLGVQGTLEMYPTDADWFTVDVVSPDSVESKYVVDTTGLVKKIEDVVIEAVNPEDSTVLPEDSTNSTDSTPRQVVKIFNFQGNYIWIRIKLSEWITGAVNSIRLNH